MLDLGELHTVAAACTGGGGDAQRHALSTLNGDTWAHARQKALWGQLRTDLVWHQRLQFCLITNHAEMVDNRSGLDGHDERPLLLSRVQACSRGGWRETQEGGC